MATTSNVHFDDMSLEYAVNIVIGGHIANDDVKNKWRTRKKRTIAESATIIFAPLIYLIQSFI